MNQIVDKKLSIQVRIDRGLHQILKRVASKRYITIKTLLEGYIADGLAVEKENFCEEI